MPLKQPLSCKTVLLSEDQGKTQSLLMLIVIAAILLSGENPMLTMEILWISSKIFCPSDREENLSDLIKYVQLEGVSGGGGKETEEDSAHNIAVIEYKQS